MKRLLILPLALLGLAACGSYESDPDDVQAIENCIESGGTPQYTADKYGVVIDYFGCVKP